MLTWRAMSTDKDRDGVGGGLCTRKGELGTRPSRPVLCPSFSLPLFSLPLIDMWVRPPVGYLSSSKLVTLLHPMAVSAASRTGCGNSRRRGGGVDSRFGPDTGTPRGRWV